MWVLALSLIAVAATTLPPTAGPPQAPLAGYPSEEALRRYTQGRLLEERNEGRDALAEYYRALLLDPRSTATMRRLSEVSARLGDAAGSLEFADQALLIEPGDAHARWLSGAALFNLGRARDALESLEAAVAADSGQVEYLKTLARVGEELDRYEVVARAYRRVVELDSRDGEAWFQLAAAEARLGRFAAARPALAEAVAINPMRPGLFFLQGWVEEGLGHRREAIELYREHLKIHAGDAASRQRLVSLLMDAKRFAEAYREVQALSRARPEDAEALAVEADLALRLGHSTRANELLARIARLAPDDPDNLDRRLDVLIRNQRHRDAVQLADEWSARYPGDYRGPMLAARTRAAAGETESALERARRSVELAPDSLAPRLLLGRIHQVRKRYQEAAMVWAETLARFPARAEIGLDLAYCREQLGDIAGAEQAARDVLADRPESASALNFLGYLLADHNLSLPEAEGLIRRAVEQEPLNGAFVDSMGWVYYRLGRLEEARRELERALELSGGDPVVHEHLGDVYKDMRLIELAREQYRRSLAVDRANGRVRSKLDGLR